VGEIDVNPLICDLFNQLLMAGPY